jgi:uncharacterized protein
MVLLLSLIVFATAVLSGIFGMGGGLILMGVLLAVLPVPAAMLLHGATQLCANGSRAALLWRHLRGAVLAPYLLGSALGLAIIIGLAPVVDRGTAYLVLGGMPLCLMLAPRLPAPGIDRPIGAFSCGVLVTTATLIAGAAGPLLDTFFLRSRLDRFEIVATKAMTQVVAHAIKIAYFGALVGSDRFGPALYAIVALSALAGTSAGTRILARMHDHGFRRWSRALVTAIAVVFVIRGAMALG